MLISSIASGDVSRYVGPTDITMMYSVTDVQGLNAISRQVLANGAQALIGMVKARLSAREGDEPAFPAVERPQPNFQVERRPLRPVIRRLTPQ